MNRVEGRWHDTYLLFMKFALLNVSFDRRFGEMGAGK